MHLQILQSLQITDPPLSQFHQLFSYRHRLCSREWLFHIRWLLASSNWKIELFLQGQHLPFLDEPAPSTSLWYSSVSNSAVWVYFCHQSYFGYCIPKSAIALDSNTQSISLLHPASQLSFLAILAWGTLLWRLFSCPSTSLFWLEQSWLTLPAFSFHFVLYFLDIFDFAIVLSNSKISIWFMLDFGFSFSDEKRCEALFPMNVWGSWISILKNPFWQLS